MRCILNQILIHINEFQAQVFILVFGIVSFIIIQLQKLISNTIFHFFNLIMVSKHTNITNNKKKVIYTTPHFKKQSFNLSNKQQSTQYSKVLYNLLTIQNSLLYLKNLPTINHGVDITNPKLPFFWRLIKHELSEPISSTVTASEIKYGVEINSDKILNNHLNLKNIQLYTNTHKSLLQFDFNLINNINIAKEQR
jgi:hypothetical protein